MKVEDTAETPKITEALLKAAQEIGEYPTDVNGKEQKGTYPYLQNTFILESTCAENPIHGIEYRSISKTCFTLSRTLIKPPANLLFFVHTNFILSYQNEFCSLP